MNYDKTKEFARDFRKLIKKFPSLAEDLEVVKRNAIEFFHIRKIDNESVFLIDRTGNTEELQFYKIKKFACKSLKGRGVRSGIRIIYAFFPKENLTVFLQIYFKAKTENEDRDRIVDFLKNSE